jgi:hypothetical protein
MNCEKTTEKPYVSLFPTVDSIPKPIFLLKRRRKSVDATQRVRLMRVIPV